MKTLRKLFMIIVTMITIIGFTSCQSEDEMEDKIIQGYCWQGIVPIRSYNDYYSRFFFDDNFTGVEEVWINGRYDKSYSFTWGWLYNSYGVLLLNYGYGDKSCIEISGTITNRHLRGYFYEHIDDYNDYKYSNYDPDRQNRWIDLTSSSQSRYH